MSSLPTEPEAFGEHVATMLRRMQPEYSINLVGPREMLVNGRRLDLENLFRMVSQQPERGVEIVEHFLDQLFEGEGLDAAELPWSLAKDRIMPRVQPESIFDHLSRELVAHVPFVNDTVIVFVIDLPHMTISITTEQMMKWGVRVDELDTVARENLGAYAGELKFQVVESREGGRAVVLAEHDGYDASRILLADLWTELAPRLGGDFYVAIPARDTFIALSLEPAEFIHRIGRRVANDHDRMPYPIAEDFFYVTRDGVAGTRGSLDMAA